jgi:hypothetical protein
MLSIYQEVSVWQHAKNARILAVNVRLRKIANIAAHIVRPLGIPPKLPATAGIRIAASTPNNRYCPIISNWAQPGTLAGWSFMNTMCLVLGKGKPDARALLYNATDLRICL